MVWRRQQPGVFRSIEPAWNDQHLREIAGHISSPLFFMHIRAAIGSAVQQTNCHPFRHGRWLFMHNGYLNELATIKRDLVLAVDPSLYPNIQGQADTELLFYLALTFGLEEDPPSAIEQGAFGYSSERNSRSLFYTTDVPTLRALYPEREDLKGFSDDARLIVSEPLGDVDGVWNEVPESTVGIVSPDYAEMRPFKPKAPSALVAVCT